MVSCQGLVVLMLGLDLFQKLPSLGVAALHDLFLGLFIQEILYCPLTLTHPPLLFSPALLGSERVKSDSACTEQHSPPSLPFSLLDCLVSFHPFSLCF